ncbi:MAG: 50S ribosome-binding GTPase [Synergistes sp.]|nr:50S ribosome-binding GTPase [Synergistes sp.]
MAECDNEAAAAKTGMAGSDAGKCEEKQAEERKSVYALLEELIMLSDLSPAEKKERLSRLSRIREKKADIMLIEAAGSGKSSTLNALFDMGAAKIGVAPGTDSVTSYVLDNLTVWNAPGLEDGAKSSEKYNTMLVKKLSETDENGDPLIDLVLVVLDASSKDLGTPLDLINKVLIPCLGEDRHGRILIGLDRADMAMKGKHWASEKNEPDGVLLEYLKKKAGSVEKRIHETTGLAVKPVYYCAGYKEECGKRCRPYNLTKLLYCIIKSIPKEKRLALADNINPDNDMWLHDDKEENYREEVKMYFLVLLAAALEDEPGQR